MKVYISGKISNNPAWKEEFQDAEEFLQKKGYTVLSPKMINADLDYEDYMAIDFAMIKVCDAVYFLPNWQDSAGAKREYEFAKQNIKALYFASEGLI